MPEYRHKPSSLRLVRGHPTAAGARLILPLHNMGNVSGAGAPGRSVDLASGGSPPAPSGGVPAGQSNGFDGVDTVTLIRGPGPYGAQLSGFSIGNYLKVTPPAPILMSAYPCWMAVLFVATTGTGTTVSTLACSGGQSSSNYSLLRLNQSGAAGAVDYFLSGSGGAPNAHAAGQATADGNSHVVMAVSTAANSHLLYFDGLPVGSGSTVNVGTVAGDQFAVGGTTAGAGSATCAVPIVFVAAGAGLVPDPLALALDWLRGEFSCVRPRRPQAATVAALADVQPVGPTAGVASLISSGPAAIVLAATDATGGATPYTYRWQVSTTSVSAGFADLADGSGVSGSATRNLTFGTPTAVLGTLYYFRLRYTDATSATAPSNVVTAQLYTGGAIGSGGIVARRGIITGGMI